MPRRDAGAHCKEILKSFWQGELKKVVAISWLLLVFFVVGKAQLGTITGELRYEHEYQDMLADNGILTTDLRQSPMLNLSMEGSVISRQLLTYSLFTGLSLNYNHSHNNIYTNSSSQSSWNKYNLLFDILPYSPVKLSLAARENTYDTKSNYNNLGDIQSQTREQEQRANLSVYQIPWLPTMNVSYVHGHSWTVVGPPSDIINQTLSFGMSGSSGPNSAVGFSGSLTDFNDRIANTDDRLFTMNFSGSKALSDQHHISVNSDYNRYETYSNLTGSVGYNGIFSNQLRLSSGVAGNTVSSATYEFRSLSVNEGLTYLADQNFQMGVGFRGTSGLSQSILHDSTETNPSSDWAGSFTVQHTLPLTYLTLSNGASIDYEIQNYDLGYRILNINLNNNVQVPDGKFVFVGDYSFLFNHNENSDWWDLIGNNAGISASGPIWEGIQTQSAVRFYEQHYLGDAASFRDQKNLILTERMNESYNYIIPFTLSFGGSINWYFAIIHGHTHSWNINFASPSFFFRGLFASYNYSRTFDVYYQRESVEQIASLLYRWRALSFEGRFREDSFPVRIRDFIFDVARTF